MKGEKLHIVSSVLLISVFLLTVNAYALKFANRQPIKFNHELHTSKLECNSCHQYYLERSVAGRPPVQICAACHTEAKTSELKKLLSYIERGEEIPWKRVYQVPDHVNFSHVRHVALGKIECSTCHGRVKEASYPLTKPLVQVNMDFCINCHKKRQISTDCNACHR